MPEITFHNPEALGKPLGQYSQITRVRASEFLFIAGQVAAEKSGACVGKDDFDAQCRQDIARFMAFRLREFPRIFPSGVYPPNTLLIVDRLVQEPFLVEVHTVAAL